MKNPSILIFLVFILSVLYLANTIDSYYYEMQTILFVFAGLAGLAIILKLFGGSKWSDESVKKIEKERLDYERAVAKLSVKQKKREKRKKRRKRRRRK